MGAKPSAGGGREEGEGSVGSRTRTHGGWGPASSAAPGLEGPLLGPEVENPRLGQMEPPSSGECMWSRALSSVFLH